MKLSELIKKLQAMKERLSLDPKVIIDWDENGWYNVEAAQLISEDDDIMINLKSSNEA